MQRDSTDGWPARTLRLIEVQSQTENRLRMVG
jgi:hypothetical protein